VFDFFGDDALAVASRNSGLDRPQVIRAFGRRLFGVSEWHENEREVMPRSGLIWTIVGILLIIALLIYIL